MKVLAVLIGLVAVCQCSVIPATTLIRAPAHDSAIIRSDRLGGNFAYSIQEGHAYAAVSPVVQQVATPVAVSYSAPAVTYSAPAVTYSAPAVVAAPAAAPAVAAAPYSLPYAAYGYPYGAALAAPTVTLDAPKYEVKTIETPAEYKALTYAAPYGYGYAPYASYAPYQIIAAPAPAAEE